MTQDNEKVILSHLRIQEIFMDISRGCPADSLLRIPVPQRLKPGSSGSGS